MKPIRTSRSNQVFGPPPGGGGWCDAVPVERTSYDTGDGQLPALRLVFELDRKDLAAILKSGQIELTIIGAGMPPVSLAVVQPEREDSLAKALESAFGSPEEAHYAASELSDRVIRADRS